MVDSSVSVCCPHCGKVRTYLGHASQIRCLTTKGGCGSKININKKHIVIKWDKEKKTGTKSRTNKMLELSLDRLKKPVKVETSVPVRIGGESRTAHPFNPERVKNCIRDEKEMSIPDKEKILKRFKNGLERDKSGIWYEFTGKLLVPYLPFKYLRSDFVKISVTDKEIRDFMEDPVREKILEEAKDYLKFAWRKCHNERGISANRSIDHFIEWFWLAGEEDFSNKIQVEFTNNYHSYGAEILEMIQKKLGDGS